MAHSKSDKSGKPTMVPAQIVAVVDTSILVGDSYQFDSKKYLKLIEHTGEAELLILIPEIVVRETKANISKDIARAIKEIKKPEVRILFNFPEILGSIPNREKTEALVDRQYVKFETFLTDCGANILAVKNANLEAVVNQYFEQKAPFAGEGKVEFPDAIAISSVAHWRTQNPGKVFILSRDKDWRDAFKDDPSTEMLNSVEELVNRVLETFAPSKFLNLVERTIEEKFQDFGMALAGEIESNFGFDLEDEDGEVTGVDDLDPHRISLSVIAINEKTRTATIQASAEIEFKAHVKFDDSSTASYDHEEGHILYRNTIQTSVDDVASVEGEIEIVFEENSETFDFISTNIKKPKNVIYVTVNQTEY